MPELMVREVGEVLLVCTAAEQPDRYQNLAEGLPVEPGWVAVVTTPAVSARPDLFDRITDVAMTYLAGLRTRVRLIPLGGLSDANPAEVGGAWLASRLGTDVILPLGPLRWDRHGRSAVASTSGDRRWMGNDPTGRAWFEPPWYPRPRWLAPGDAPLPEGSGRATLRAIPAGYWIVGREAPAGADIGAVEAPDHDRATVYLGGSRVAPPDAADVTWLLGQLPRTGAERLVVLPRAWTGTEIDFAGFTDVVAGVPARRTGADWRIITVDDAGRITWRPSTMDIVARTAPGEARRMPPAKALPPVRPHQPEAVDAPGLRTPDGWSFLPPEGSPIGTRGRSPYFVVEFDGAWDDPPTVAKLVQAVSRGSGRPLVVVAHGIRPLSTDHCRQLAADLGARVISAAGPIGMTIAGDLTTAGSFYRWDPSAGAGDEPEPLGPTLPPLPRLYPIEAPPRTLPVPIPIAIAIPIAIPATAIAYRGPVARPRPVLMPEVPVAPPQTPVVLAVPVPAPVAAVSPMVVVPAAGDEQDRAALREVLNGRYDAHARIVARTLAELPGLRAGGTPTELTVGLIALHALHAGETPYVNLSLRGRGEAGAAHAARVVASCAIQGLSRLPVVIGPTFLPGRLPTSFLAAYRPGMTLVEPAFLTVALIPQACESTGDDATTPVDFAIWSVGAHRLSALVPSGVPSAVFRPGSRFEVLAVDSPAAGGWPYRVLLTEIPESGARPDTGRTTERLRELATRAHDGPARPKAYPPMPLELVPGIGSNGRPFATHPLATHPLATHPFATLPLATEESHE
jgi:hypothetical protein